MHNKTKTNTELQQTTESTLNNRSTATELPPYNRHQPEPLGGVNTCYRRQTLALDSVGVKSRHKGITNKLPTTRAHPVKQAYEDD